MLLKLDRILFICSCIYLLGVVGWVVSRNSSAQISDSQGEFITYLQDALVKIESDQPVNESEIPRQPQPQIPPPKQLERVYIPLYQPPQIITQAPPPPPPVAPPVTSQPVLSSIPETKIDCTLVGLLESEQGAIALFKFNDLTERVEVGQEILGTGWILQDIVNNQAIVGQNNLVKTIAVGQTF